MDLFGHQQSWLSALLVSLMLATTVAAQPITSGERISLYSETLDEERAVLLHLPESYLSSDFRYPVFYLLDGDSEFFHQAGIIEFLAGTGQIPEMIVVAVGNTIRSRDLTPPSANEEETAFWPEVGGADRFLQFFRSELIPFVDERYRTVPFRIIRGQSFGGLLAVHDYMSPNPTFDAYLTSSASVGWNDGELLERAPKFFETGVPRPLYVAAAGRDVPENLTDIRKFVDIVAAEAPGDDSWRFDFFESESHYSLVHRATYRGLKFLYDGWQVVDEVAARGRFEDYEQHYALLSQRFGYSITIPMLTVIQLGNRLLREQRYDDGIRVLKKNLELYPNQPDSHWHVGDGYVLSGQPRLAEKYFDAALRKAREMGLEEVDLYEESLTELRKILAETELDSQEQ